MRTKYAVSGLRPGESLVFPWLLLPDGEPDHAAHRRRLAALYYAGRRRGWRLLFDGEPAGLRVTRVR